jgi:hypothetical protein
MLPILTSDQKQWAGSRRWPVYDLFGLKMASDFGFATSLIEGPGRPDLAFTCVPAMPSGSDWDEGSPAYASAYRSVDGESVAYLYRLEDCDVFRFTRVADFYLGPDRLLCHLLDRAYDYLVEIRLMGPVLSFWLERQGIPALHASSAVVGDRAVVFLSSNGSGKSSLAASLMQAGHPLLTDDILPVEERHGAFVGRPGYPQMRLWPDEAIYFLGHYDDLGLVHPGYSKRRVPVGRDGFGTFWHSPCPLACIYVPERRESVERGMEIEITPISPRDAVMELVRHSFSAHVVEAVGLQPRRLKFFARMAEQLPMRRIAYPSGLQHLSQARDAIREDLTRLP